MSELNTVLDMDSILDMTLDGVKDVPDFVNPPSGAYILSIGDAKFEIKKNKDNEKVGRFTVTYKVEQTIELASDKELPVADGSLFSESFTYTEDGIAYLKKQAKKLLNVDSVDGVSLRDLLDSLKDLAPFKAKIVTQEKNGYINSRITPVHEA